jgi:hypothetical protein
MVIRTCLNCKKNFNTYPCFIRNGYARFCSRSCTAKYTWSLGKHKTSNGHASWNRGKTKKEDNRIAQPWLGKKRLDMIGKLNPSWKGGITLLEKTQRNKFRKTMQKLIFERDNYTCQMCGATKCFLQVDHIQSWAEYIKLRFDINNCRTLCMKCHYKITWGKDMPENTKTWGHNFRRIEREVFLK